MKLNLVGFVAALTLCTAVQAAPYITIGDSRFFLANANPALREYIPAGQTLDNWEELAAIRFLKDQTDPNAYLDKLGHQVVKDNPKATAQLFRNEAKKTSILDFVTFPTSTKSPQFLEWNLFRATYIEGKGVVVYQYAKRFYKNPPLNGPMWQAQRVKMYQPFEAATFEEVEDAKQ
jgi:hypothetical protein